MSLSINRVIIICLAVYSTITFLMMTLRGVSLNIYATVGCFSGAHLYITTSALYGKSKKRIEFINGTLHYMDQSGMLPVSLSDTETWPGFHTVLSKRSDEIRYARSIGSINRKELQIAMFLRRNSSLSHFLFNTTAAWAFLFDDDADFAPQNFARTLDFFESRYDTETDPIIMGQHLHNKFLPGGAGYIVSRRFAKIFLEKFEIEMSTMTLADDWHMSQMAKMYAKQPDCYFGRFSTRGICQNSLSLLLRKNFSGIPSCKTVKKKNVGLPFDPILSFMFSYHKFEDFKGERWSDLVDIFPENLMLYQRPVEYEPCVCAKD